jgi:hypothetical protein
VLTTEQACLFIGQLFFAAIIAALFFWKFKGNVLELLKGETGNRALRFFAFWSTLTVIGNLTLLKAIDPAAGCGLIGSLLGYVFGNTASRRTERQDGGDNDRSMA